MFYHSHFHIGFIGFTILCCIHCVEKGIDYYCCRHLILIFNFLVSLNGEKVKFTVKQYLFIYLTIFVSSDIWIKLIELNWIETIQNLTNWSKRIKLQSAVSATLFYFPHGGSWRVPWFYSQQSGRTMIGHDATTTARVYHLKTVRERNKMCSLSQALGTAINSTKVMTAQQVVRTDDGGEVSSTPEMYRNVTSVFMFVSSELVRWPVGLLDVSQWRRLCFFSHVVGSWSELKYKNGALNIKFG